MKSMNGQLMKKNWQQVTDTKRWK